MNRIYLSDTALEGVVGGAGQGVMSYNPETGVLIQNFLAVPANSAAYGDGTGTFRVRIENPNAGVADIGGHALINALNK